jgi:hypothetical protein
MKPDPNYPRMLFHRSLPPVTVQSQNEEQALGPEWSRTIPGTIPVPKSAPPVYPPELEKPEEEEPPEPEEDEPEEKEPEEEERQPVRPPLRKPAPRPVKPAARRRR